MPRSLCAVLLLAACLLPSCSLHSTAKEWHGRVGPDGKPVYLLTSTHIGFNLLVVIPVIGNTDIPTQIAEVTDSIAQEGGDNVRIVQTGSEVYWYGWPPLTWIVTPVVSSTMAEYQPSAATFEADRAVWEGTAEPE